MLSNAVGLERVSNIVGYKISKGNFSESSPNLPQRIAVLAEANTASQAGMLLTPQQITSAQQAGNLFGFGSPIHIISRILLPISGDGVGGIPVIVYPQAAAVSSTARAQTVTVTGTATGNGTHYVKVAGRNGIDGSVYAVNIVTGDTPTIVAGKIRDAINNVLSSPLSASAALGVATATTKWTGLTAQEVTLSMDTVDTSLGLTYVVAETAAGAGTPDIAAALALFGSDWNTIVLNSYTATTTMAALESFNGIPSDAPTGRYAGIIMKPFIAITGSLLDDPTTITDGRSANVTIAIAPAPLSAGLSMEAAANMTVLFARVAQDEPHLDVAGKFYPDMPGPVGNPAMTAYNVRDSYVKKGSSTVDVVSGVYKVEDFVTTYHPAGEVPPQYRYCRNLMVHFNIRFSYYLLEQIHVVGHAIAADGDIVRASKVIKPKQWKQIVGGKTFAEDLGKRALIADVPFMQESIETGISSTNPDRLETFFRYKITGTARIAATTAEAGFNFGTV